MKKIKSGKLTFVENIYVNQKELYQELIEGSHVYWEPNLKREYREENNRDWREDNVLKWRMAKGSRTKLAYQNEVSHFVFNEKKIRNIKDDYPKNFSIMDRNSMTMTNYYNYKGNMDKHFFNFDAKSNPSWNVDFFIKREKHITKNILGFNCYKTLVIELKQIEGKLDIEFHEMYVTPEIDLPAHIVQFLNAFAIEECPLEIKSSRLGHVGIHNQMSATKFEAYNTTSELILPEEYHAVRDDMNLEKPYNYKEARQVNRYKPKSK